MINMKKWAVAFLFVVGLTTLIFAGISMLASAGLALYGDAGIAFRFFLVSAALFAFALICSFILVLGFNEEPI